MYYVYHSHPGIIFVYAANNTGITILIGFKDKMACT